MNELNYYKFHSQLALPFLETNIDLLEKIFEILSINFGLKRNSSQRFIDLGSGDGRIVIFAATHYFLKAFGIEIDKTLIRESHDNVKSLKQHNIYNRRLLSKIKIVEADFFTYNLKKYDFIYIYSLPSMQIYLSHVIKTARSSAIIISHKYELNHIKSLLNLEWKLNHNNKKNRCSTYYYSIIDSE